jgi:hypothetical protein
MTSEINGGTQTEGFDNRITVEYLEQGETK